MAEIAVHCTAHCSRELVSTHRHQEAYVALVLSGGYDEIGPDGIWCCQAGDLVLHPPFHVHSDRMTSSGARVLNFVLPFSSQLLTEMSVYRVVRPTRPERVERAAFRDTEDALREALGGAEPGEPTSFSDWRDSIAQRLANSDSCSISELARAEGVSAEHASRAFQAKFGIGPARFRAEQRFRRVIQALSETRDSLSEVAHAAGYADQAHMSRAVKSVTGMSPHQLRCVFQSLSD